MGFSYREGPLYPAVVGGHAAIVQRRIQHLSLDLTEDCNAPLLHAASLGQVEVLEAMLTHRHVNAAGFDNAVLRAAAAGRQCAVMEALLEHRLIQRSLAREPQVEGKSALLAALDAYRAAGTAPPLRPLLQILLPQPAAAMPAAADGAGAGAGGAGAGAGSANGVVTAAGSRAAAVGVAVQRRMIASVGDICAAAWARRRAVVLARAIALLPDADDAGAGAGAGRDAAAPGQAPR